MRMHRHPCLRFDGVHKSCGPGRDILADTDLSLEPGSMTVLKLAYLGLRPKAMRASVMLA